ncbi:MAG: cupin domain-containing protein [Bacteroidales bacterium]|jgi:cupin 2 domain-containing protein|nr:cupin domain-containing protein [Bacteroidales bacterium]MDD2687654.1 cupin domain-containing protein [Bacteroidales bacterium]MDD3331129.1 cupin domain-containing protein [Bacteroidales bacterium]MDD3691288.1 cupin domain-containing protein [Bacteroidales bacterium]MDD4044222.1 cupin domain-containing protein [Bacteroidales bacterium]
MNSIRNLLQLEDVDFTSNEEVFDEILTHKNFYIERIISYGQCSDDWYDQDLNEWLVLLDGCATISYEDGNSVELQKGDNLLIPAHQKHKVSYTTQNPPCIWLTIFYE